MINLYNTDCLNAMLEMPDKKFDLAIVDPPISQILQAKKMIWVTTQAQQASRDRQKKYNIGKSNLAKNILTS